MTNGNGNNSFSWGDALFLHIERPGQPLNIAGVSMFEGEIKLADLRAFVESKLPLIPRYRQRAVPSPFDFGLPTWEFDPQFDIRNHVREVKLKHGTEDELKALAGKIVSQSLDRQRPLWDFTLARLKSGRTGMVTRIHHCLADGIAGVGAMNVILDASPNPPPVSRKRLKATPPPTPKDAGAALLDGLAKSYLSPVSYTHLDVYKRQVLEPGTYVMVRLPKNWGMYDCACIDLYASTADPASGEKLGEYCLVEK